MEKVMKESNVENEASLLPSFPPSPLLSSRLPMRPGNIVTYDGFLIKYWSLRFPDRKHFQLTMLIVRQRGNDVLIKKRESKSRLTRYREKNSSFY